jgi:alpha-mannosidase
MKPTELLVLLPCHSLEDFPTHHRGLAAEGLLSAWTALWHPAFIASAQKVPNWGRIDDPPAPSAGAIVVVPTVAELDLSDDFKQRVAEANAHLISGIVNRNEIVSRALSTMETIAPAVTHPSLVDDFYALGLAFLLTELLTRRMRYMSRIDETAFQEKVVAAATAASNDDTAGASESLTRAFEILMEARAHFYPVDTNLLDFTLVAEATIGDALRDELGRGTAANVLSSGDVIEQMAGTEPLSLEALRSAVADGRASVVGGEFAEVELPLLPLDSMLAVLRGGLERYNRQLSAVPRVFGRRRFGLTPALPQLLRGLGYHGVLHFTLDDGRFPEAERSKTSWEGAGYSSIDTIGRVPLDARDAGSILQLPEKLGESMDYDYVSMLSFVHWPGQASVFYGDFRRVAKFAPVFGKFVTVDDFFTNTESAGQFSRFEPDQYRSPFLAQAVRAGRQNYLASHTRRHALRFSRSTAEAFNTWAALLRGVEAGGVDQSLTNEIEIADVGDDKMFGEIQNRLQYIETSAEVRLAEAIARETSSQSRSLMVLNAAGFSQQGIVPLADTLTPTVGGPVLAVEHNGNATRALVEVPAFGFAWLSPNGECKPASTARKAKAPPPIAQANTLSNEYCEISINPETGGIQLVRDFTVRGNRLSQQLVMRLPERPLPIEVDQAIAATGYDRRYTRMMAESVEVTDAGSVCGEITSRGRLVDGDRTVAKFVQKTRLAAGSRIVEIGIELDSIDEPLADPWASYYACRWAWAEDFSELRRSVQGASHATDLQRFESPDFVEIVATKARTAILPGGLPFHVRSGSRMLDTLLVVHGDGERRFRLGIAVEHPRPWQAACEFNSPVCIVPVVLSPPARATTGWFFHLDAKNVTVTHWFPLVEGKAVVGFRARLLEMAGQGVSAHLRSFRTVSSARRVDFLGEQIEELQVDGDRIRIDLGSHELVEIEARW